jgi:hypothetical protein
MQMMTSIPASYKQCSIVLAATSGKIRILKLAGRTHVRGDAAASYVFQPWLKCATARQVAIAIGFVVGCHALVQS